MLKLAADLRLPTDVSTEAVAILARRGRGKTYTAAVYAEELYEAGIPFVVLDPTGGIGREVDVEFRIGPGQWGIRVCYSFRSAVWSRTETEQQMEMGLR